ncbi:hypothetical protein PHISP_08245 [Aspergillus sp. HF37]|nr:hypothetical protein PHISP_08245 [Aspergillus sp. HF37]
MSPPNKFSWQETKPGQWERDIDKAEQFYTSLAKAYEGSGRTFFAITVEYNVEQQKSVKVYRTLSGDHSWLENTFQTVSEAVCGTEWCNSDPPVPALPTLFLVKIPPGG